MALTPNEIAGRKYVVERRLMDLKKAHGVAVLDETEFDASRIAEAEAEIAALDVAGEEAERRAAEARPFERRKQYDAKVAEYRAAEKRKLAALADAEKATKALATAVVVVHEAHAAMQAVEQSLCGQTNESVSALPVRLGAFFRAALRAAGLSGYALGITLNVDHEATLVPGDGTNWADAEAKHSSASWLEKNAPKVPG